MQRARKVLDERLPARSQQATLRSLGDETVRSLVRRYTQAMENADVESVVAILVEDATWSMPPLADLVPRPGRDQGLPRRARAPAPLAPRPDARERPARSALLHVEPRGGRLQGEALDVLSFAGDRIAAIDAFRDPAVPASFGHPFALEP